jgi:hypothetical protein
MKRIILALTVMALAGCVTLPTGPSVPMAPAAGKPFDLYLVEDEKCRQLAEGRLGNDYDYFSTQEAQYHYDNVFVQCMLSHGNLILSPGMYRQYRTLSPAPGDYPVPPPGTPPQSE